jgi:perosamine synthetase
MNLRMPTVCAALGLSQLEQLPKMIQSRREMAQFYGSHLSDLEEVKPLIYPNSNQSVYCTYNLLFKDTETRDNSVGFLKEKGIPTRLAYSPTHLYSFYVEKYGHSRGDLPITEDISKRGLTIPLHLGLRKKDLEKIVSLVKESL